LQPGEILREIRIRKGNGRSGHAYQKVPHPASGFAVVGVAVNLSRANDGSCAASRIGITGVASKVYRASAVESALNGKPLDERCRRQLRPLCFGRVSPAIGKGPHASCDPSRSIKSPLRKVSGTG
jgi:carbon-monoxide dehydrogenase medium subunit